MYALQDAVGEECVNRALRRFLAANRFGGPPYPTARELLTNLREESPPEAQDLISDLFEKITLYDNRVTSADCERLPDGRYRLALEVIARKLYADGRGVETETPINDWIDIGAFGKSGVLALERHRIDRTESRFELLLDDQPVRAGIDPFHKLIDRVADDNVKRVTMTDPTTP